MKKNDIIVGCDPTNLNIFNFVGKALSTLANVLSVDRLYSMCI